MTAMSSSPSRKRRLISPIPPSCTVTSTPSKSVWKPAEETRQPHVTDGRQHAEPDRRAADQAEVGRNGARRLRFIHDVLKVRQHRTPELADENALSLTMEQRIAEFRLEIVDGLGQRRLGNAAFVRRTREIQASPDRQGIANLRHLHGRLSALGPLSPGLSTESHNPRLSIDRETIFPSRLVSWSSCHIGRGCTLLEGTEIREIEE